MTAVVSAFVCGLVFGLGLILSGMTDPARVLGFLDVAGAWNPALALVMGPAVGVAAAGYALARRWRRPVCAPDFSWPQRRTIDRRLVIGSVLFGIGWGLSGICPGPALVSAGHGLVPALVFTVSMVAGMMLCRHWREARAAGAETAPGKPALAPGHHRA